MKKGDDVADDGDDDAVKASVSEDQVTDTMYWCVTRPSDRHYVLVCHKTK
jgi:hypothetical protein